MGYLRLPNGEPRHVPELDTIARDIRDHNIRVVWAMPPNGRRACAYLWQRLIILHPAMAEAEGPELRECLAHECGHFAVGRNEERVYAWMRARYGSLLPAWA